MNHFDDNGNAVMVDVSDKPITLRHARASGTITVSREAIEAVKGGTSRKGDVLSVAQIAGITAAKRTHELIPLCHMLPLDKCAVDFEVDEENLQIIAASEVEMYGRTGCEMEALTAVSVALLTVYDMIKAIDKGMIIGDIRLLEKSGGKSGTWKA